MMLRSVTSTLVACGFAATVSVFAQQPQAPPPPASQPAPAQAQETPKSTLTGCVVEAKTTDGTTAYVLDNTQGGSAKMYVLLGSTPTEFASNVNKKIEVSGPVREPGAPAEGAAADSKVLRPPVVQVESTKVVAESCK
jgi:hypothetical protein